jgi:hypothetical protein
MPSLPKEPSDQSREQAFVRLAVPALWRGFFRELSDCGRRCTEHDLGGSDNRQESMLDALGPDSDGMFGGAIAHFTIQWARMMTIWLLRRWLPRTVLNASHSD